MALNPRRILRLALFTDRRARFTTDQLNALVGLRQRVQAGEVTEQLPLTPVWTVERRDGRYVVMCNGMTFESCLHQSDALQIAQDRNRREIVRYLKVKERMDG